jgi:hypothetical protein
VEPGLPIVAGAQTETDGLCIKLNHCRKIAATAESGVYLRLCAFGGIKEPRPRLVMWRGPAAGARSSADTPVPIRPHCPERDGSGDWLQFA